jgi:hypothetical protein
MPHHRQYVNRCTQLGISKYESLMEIEEHYKLQEDLGKYFTSKYARRISREDIFWSLFIVFGDEHKLEWPCLIWDLELGYEDCIQRLSSFDFDSLKNGISTLDALVPEEFLFKFKVRVKFKGDVWVIHRYDQDPFPSNPHAHCLGQNIKLDLSNGNCYRVREFLYKMKSKDLIQLRNIIEKVYKDELPPLAV